MRNNRVISIYIALPKLKLFVFGCFEPYRGMTANDLINCLIM